MDARLVELWLRLTADAVRGADDAQRALEALSSAPLTESSLSAWMKLWLPEARSDSGRVSPTDVSEFETLLESWWRLLGVVPRYRYDELQQRYDELRRRLEQAEGTMRRLRGTLSSTGHEAEAQAVLDAWEQVTRQTLDAQAEWARHWLDGWGASDPREASDDEQNPKE
jgi:hypothetical protein